MLGLFPRTPWPAADTTPRARGTSRAHRLPGRRRPSPTSAPARYRPALGRSTRPHKVVDHEGTAATKRQLKKRAKEIAEGEWAAKAVKDAITAATAAIVARGRATRRRRRPQLSLS